MIVFQGTTAGRDDSAVVGRIARPPAVIATVHNTGDRPVYDVRIHWVDRGTGTPVGVEDQAGTVGPGGSAEQERAVSGGRWTVTPNGSLAPVGSELAPGAPQIATFAAARRTRTDASAG